MARIRTIKPDHWEDEAWNNVSIQAHLLWIAMKNFADDKGIISSNPVLIKNKAFPTREDIRTSDIKTWLETLEKNSFLIPFEYEKKGYYMLDFKDERIDKPQPSILPKVFFDSLQERSRIVENIPEHSGTFENTPALEDSSKGEGKEQESIGTPNGVAGLAEPTQPVVSILERSKKFIEKFNTLRITKFRVTDKVKEKLNARLKNYDPGQIIEALKTAQKDKYHIENNFQYLTPEYILREDILERYLNANPINNTKKTGNVHQTTIPAAKSGFRTVQSGK
jgi:hypothetical protein